MLSFFSAKGGAGCSVVAAGCALLSARDQQTLLVDLNGDLPDVLGLEPAEPSRQGVGDWLGATAPLPDTLRRLEVRVGDSLALLPTGETGPGFRPEQWRVLAHLLASEGRRVVIDVGHWVQPPLPVLSASDRTVLVTRACYLALRAAARSPGPDDIVLVSEPGRALGPNEVGSYLGVDIGAVVKWDPAVARAVDAGLLAGRLPRSLRSLGTLL